MALSCKKNLFQYNYFGLMSYNFYRTWFAFRQLRETVFNFCQKELAPHAEAIDKANNFPQMREFWRKLGDMGLLGITASPDFGGSGMGYLDHCIVMEEMSRYRSGHTNVRYFLHCQKIIKVENCKRLNHCVCLLQGLRSDSPKLRRPLKSLRESDQPQWYRWPEGKVLAQAQHRSGH